MIVAVGADKGAPGATTLAVLLGVHWPTDRVVIEADPRGADLPYRLHTADGQPLAASPSITTLAVETRPGGPARSLAAYAQATAIGVPVLAGEMSAHRFERLAGHLPAIAAAAAGWSGTAITDVGPLAVANPAMQLARAATVVVLVSRADTESLGRLRERVEELAGVLGGAHLSRLPLGVVVRGEPGDRQAARRVERLLVSIGSPVPVVGMLPSDPNGVAALWSGPLSRRAARSPVMSAGRAITERLRGMWPELTEAAPHRSATHSAAAVASGGQR